MSLKDAHNEYSRGPWPAAPVSAPPETFIGLLSEILGRRVSIREVEIYERVRGFLDYEGVGAPSGALVSSKYIEGHSEERTVISERPREPKNANLFEPVGDSLGFDPTDLGD